MEDYEDLTVTLKAKTSKAALFDYTAGEVWTPLSVLSEDSRDSVEQAKQGDTLDIEVASWWAKKEDLVD